MSTDENPALAVRVPVGPRSAIRRDASKMLGFDRLGALVASIMAVGVFASPFVTYRATRIAAGEPRSLFEAFPSAAAIALLALMIAVAVLAVVVRRPSLRLLAAGSGLALLLPAIGWAARFVTPAGNTFARVSPALGLLAPRPCLGAPAGGFAHASAVRPMGAAAVACHRGGIAREPSGFRRAGAMCRS